MRVGCYGVGKGSKRATGGQCGCSTWLEVARGKARMTGRQASNQAGAKMDKQYQAQLH